MENFVIKNGIKYRWVDGNTLVRVWGEEAVNDELYGSGFSAKLSAFIAKRDALLLEESKNRKPKPIINKKKSEPTDELNLGA